jgi:hypothetical protein
MFHHLGTGPDFFDILDCYVDAAFGVINQLLATCFTLAVSDFLPVNFVNGNPIAAVEYVPRHQIRVERMRLASLILILHRNLRAPPLTPPSAVILGGAVRACPAIDVLGQLRLVAERMRIAEFTLKP